MRCPDRGCEPEKGEDGCMALICNQGAMFSEDFVYIAAWDHCPVMDGMEERRADEQAEEQAAFSHWERLMEADGVA